ncbi:unnamed protein product [Somion occarium]|uniref:F-box domain-containing protein n=1 Tax=Somion occarium TaxID=3059160 RepID=A0ABP1DB78_9APHY
MKLVEDLIPIILDSADHPAQHDLSRFALVSSQWLWPARKRLYASPTIHTFEACNRLARTLQQNVELQSLIRGIKFDPTTPTTASAVVVNYFDWVNIVYVLRLNRLRSLELAGNLALFATKLTQRVDRFRQLTSLHLDGSAFQSSASFDWDRTTASQLSGLTHLSLKKLRLIIAHPSVEVPLQLTHLSFDDVMIFPGDLHHLCHGHWHTLRHLRIAGHTDLDTNEELRSTLELCTNLVSFEYEARGVWEHGAIYDDRLPVIPSLRRLALLNVLFGQESLQCIDRSFHNLEELTVAGARSYRISPDDWVDALKEHSFRSLHTLNTPRPVEGAPLQEICFNRNITLLRYV